MSDATLGQPPSEQPSIGVPNTDFLVFADGLVVAKFNQLDLASIQRLREKLDELERDLTGEESVDATGAQVGGEHGQTEVALQSEVALVDSPGETDTETTDAETDVGIQTPPTATASPTLSPVSSLTLSLSPPTPTVHLPGADEPTHVVLATPSEDDTTSDSEASAQDSEAGELEHLDESDLHTPAPVVPTTPSNGMALNSQSPAQDSEAGALEHEDESAMNAPVPSPPADANGVFEGETDSESDSSGPRAENSERSENVVEHSSPQGTQFSSDAWRISQEQRNIPIKYYRNKTPEPTIFEWIAFFSLGLSGMYGWYLFTLFTPKIAFGITVALICKERRVRSG